MRKLATLGLMVGSIMNVSPALADESLTDNINVEFYGTLLPFFENVGTSGATNSTGFVTGTSLLAVDQHTGINHDRRFRMTSGTSNIGFRGDFGIAGDTLKLIWQVESPAPIDGEGPSNWAARNSHVGFSGFWGSLVYGNWDTPMRWASVTSVNPIKGGYTGDLTAIIGTPGHSVPAWNSDQLFRAAFQVGENPVGFFRHEANSVQYWSPTVAGFSLRLMYAANEHRIAGIPNNEQGVNPYVVSGSLGFDYEWLRVRYSAELHKDLFGTRIFGVGPFLDPVGDGTFMPRSSTDVGHLGLVSLRFNRETDYETRLVGVGDYLSYHTDVLSVNTINEFSRPAFYVLAQQSFGNHDVWVSYGQAFEGSCTITGGTPCTTGGLGAVYPSAGYMYSFAESASIYALGYYVINDVSARYTSFPMLDARENSVDGLPNIAETSAGSDTFGAGIGFVYAFNVKLLGGDGEPKPAATNRPPAEKPVAPPPDEVAPEPEAEAPARDEPPAEAPDTAPENVELQEEPEGEAPAAD
ncbi:MAG TPA: porin [Polyangiaceae bacterium]|nr:porin [Polyangiaceae bacterium]